MLIECGDNILDPNEIAAVSWKIHNPKDNGGVSRISWYKIIFRNSNQTIEVNDDSENYRDIQRQVDILRSALIGVA